MQIGRLSKVLYIPLAATIGLVGSTVTAYNEEQSKNRVPVEYMSGDYVTELPKPATHLRRFN